MKELKVGSDFSGVGAFDYALKRVAERKGFKVRNLFACDMDKHARKAYLANHSAPENYPTDVYERSIPEESLDIYMTSPPCQAFSMVGQRKGKSDERGILFDNSHEFIQKNKPRFFIFENVRGLLSEDGGRTFAEWVRLLGGKSVNGLPVIFPDEDSVPYHLYHALLNSKDYGVPQNRPRVFLIGVRDDQNNNFRWPKIEKLQREVKEILEDQVEDRYYLSDRMLKYFREKTAKRSETKLGFKFSPSRGEGYAMAITTKEGSRIENNYIIDDNNGGKIRKLTPRECFRLMDFPEEFDPYVVSNGQSVKQAGNSIVVKVLELIIEKLDL